MRNCFKLLSSVLFIALATACTLKTDRGEKGVSKDEYNALVERFNENVNKYNALVGSTNAAQDSSISVVNGLEDLDRVVSSFNLNVSLASTLPSDKSCGLGAQAYRNANSSFGEVMKAIGNLEVLALKNMSNMKENAKNFLVAKVDARLVVAEVAFGEQGKALDGIRTLVRQSFASLRTQEELKNGACVATYFGQSIQLSEEEKAVVSSSGKAGFVRSGSTVSSLKTEADVVNTAQSLGLDRRAASHAYKISSSSGGVVALAADSDALGKAVTDIFALIKSDINRNTQDLEVVFAIDYSGSMSDDIQIVIDNLTAIVNSLNAVQVSGRKVRVGISLFGRGGNESILLNLTENMVDVGAKLREALDTYGTRQHSDDPGESSYAGLLLTAQKISWKSSNRKIIMITDEPSKEIETGQSQKVDEANRALAANGIQTSIYTIIVGNN